MNGFVTYLVLMGCVIPTAMIFCGIGFVRHPHEKINNLSGYRTYRSRLSQETWDFAQKHSGLIWIKWGSVMLLPSLLLAWYAAAVKGDYFLNLYLCFAQISLLILSLFPTEWALKREFDEYGRRKA